MEMYGVKTQDEHFIPSPNEWTNQESELNHPTIPKELCDGGLTRLSGPFGVGQVLLQQFETFCNRFHPLSNGDQQVTNCAYDLSHTWTTPK
jgi:hypothetical protein